MNSSKFAFSICSGLLGLSNQYGNDGLFNLRRKHALPRKSKDGIANEGPSVVSGSEYVRDVRTQDECTDHCTTQVRNQ